MHQLSLTIVICIIIVRTDASCPPRTFMDNPRFLIDPKRAISGEDEMYISIDCCFDGYVELKWNFRRQNGSPEDISLTRMILRDDNRTLIITRPFKNIDTGFYLCLAEDRHGNTLSGSIFVYFLYYGETKYIRFLSPDTSPETRFQIGETIKLVCQGLTYEPNVPVSITWLLKKNQRNYQITRVHYINTTETRAANRSPEINPDIVSMSSSLLLPYATVDDTGEYVCQMTQIEAPIEKTFVVSVVDDSINWRLLIPLVISTTTLFISTILGWKYYYDIIVIYKSYLDPCPRGCIRKIDVSILYEDIDMSSLRVAFEVARYLEINGFRCWLYDRDKIYGGDMMEEYALAMNQSHVLLIILSPSSSTCVTMISSIVPDPLVRRLYLFIPNQTAVKCLLADLGAVRWMKQELTLQTIIQNNKADWNLVNSDKSPYHQLSIWIMASMPSTVIRDARQRITNTIETTVEIAKI